eukprot:scaffold9864_cov67-Skeletonema_dohrnii-CCMP3373.AAC.1
MLLVVTDGRADEQTQELILLFEFQLHHAMGIADSGRVVVAVALKAVIISAFTLLSKVLLLPLIYYLWRHRALRLREF